MSGFGDHGNSSDNSMQLNAVTHSGHHLARFLHRLHDLRWHVIFVVFSQHFARNEKTIAIETTVGNYSLSLAKQVGQDAGVFNLYHLLIIGEIKLDRQSFSGPTEQADCLCIGNQ